MSVCCIIISSSIEMKPPKVLRTILLDRRILFPCSLSNNYSSWLVTELCLCSSLLGLWPRLVCWSAPGESVTTTASTDEAYPERDASWTADFKIFTQVIQYYLKQLSEIVDTLTDNGSWPLTTELELYAATSSLRLAVLLERSCDDYYSQVPSFSLCSSNEISSRKMNSVQQTLAATFSCGSLNAQCPWSPYT